MKTQTKQILDRAQTICRDAGVRLTEKRKRVLQVVIEAKEPLSAYQIADAYREEHGESLSVMSIYRMLNFLKENNLVHRLETTNQYLSCSHITCNHQHEVPQFLICDHCQGVSEVGIRKEIFNELNENIKGTGFQMARQQFEFHGTCDQCREL